MATPAAAPASRRLALSRLLVPWLAGLPACPLLAAAEVATAALLERRVKAAFLYKFVGYTIWPDSAFARPHAPVVIAVLGDDALADELVLAVAGRTVEGRALEIRRLRDVDNLGGIHVLFVAAAERARTTALARVTGNQPVLLVSEADGALAQGSVINFVMTAGRVKFEIAPDAAEKRGVKLSSRLRPVAQAVRAGNAP